MKAIRVSLDSVDDKVIAAGILKRDFDKSDAAIKDLLENLPHEFTGTEKMLATWDLYGLHYTVIGPSSF